jgi:hypothetical protein
MSGTVHCLHEGLALCGLPGAPATWPEGHTWLSVADWPRADSLMTPDAKICQQCAFEAKFDAESSLRGNEAAEGRQRMERKYEVGQPIMFIDTHRVARHAIAIHWWMPGKDSPYSEEWAAVNLMLADPDPQKEDTYGRQICRETSVPHLSANPAKGFCWCWPDEVP